MYYLRKASLRCSFCLMLCFVFFSIPLAARSLRQDIEGLVGARQFYFYLYSFSKNQIVMELGRQDQFLQIASLQKLINTQILLNRNSNLKNLNFNCTGSIKIKNEKLFCWKKEGHGKLDLVQALAHSCNLYFYQMSQKFVYKEWMQAFQKLFPKQKKTNDYVHDWAGDNWDRKFHKEEFLDWAKKLRQEIKEGNYPEIYWGMTRAVQEGTAQQGTLSHKKYLAKTGTSFQGQVPSGLVLAYGPNQEMEYLLFIRVKESHGFEIPSLVADLVMAYLEKKGE